MNQSTSMIFEKIIVGPLQVNCYLLGLSNTGEAILIDPGAEARKIKKRLKTHNLKVNTIVYTHGHADHIGANHQLNCPVSIHRMDANFLTNPRLNLSGMFESPISLPEADILLEDGQKIKLGEICLEVIHTPGHTPGGICLNTGKICFTGDTLFAGGIGRTDIPGASEEDLLNSIRSRLLTLEDDVVIYPGHGPSSTIGEEKANFI